MDILDPTAGERLKKLIEVYDSHFASVFYVSAATGETVDELFTAVAMLADSDGVEAAANAPAQNGEQGADGCC
jgi:hypothetical protein